MKRLALLLVVVLCSATLLQAAPQDKEKEAGNEKMMSMIGMVCSDKCVTTEGEKSSCNSSCSETGGNMVFVDDKGKLYKVDNEDKVMPMSGKKVKVKCKMADNGMMHVYEIAPATY